MRRPFPCPFPGPAGDRPHGPARDETDALGFRQAALTVPRARRIVAARDATDDPMRDGAPIALVPRPSDTKACAAPLAEGEPMSSPLRFSPLPRLRDPGVIAFATLAFLAAMLLPGHSWSQQRAVLPSDSLGMTFGAAAEEGASLRAFDLQRLSAGAALEATAGQIGQVFALTRDDGVRGGYASGVSDLYLAATSLNGIGIVVPDGNGGEPKPARRGAPGATFAPGQFGIESGGSPGTIWRLDAVSGQASVFARIAGNSGPGLGDIAFDKASRQFFASDLDTGLVHRLDSGGRILDAFDHGVTARAAAGLAPLPDDGVEMDIGSPAFDVDDPAGWGLTQAERQVRAVQARGGRLFYGAAGEVWSVGIKPDGGFAADARREISLAGGAPVADIGFDGNGTMQLFRRGFASGIGKPVAAAEASVEMLRYRPRNPDEAAAPDLWVLEGASTQASLAGAGLDLQHGFDSGLADPAACAAALLRGDGEAAACGQSGDPPQPTPDVAEPPAIASAKSGDAICRAGVPCSFEISFVNSGQKAFSGDVRIGDALALEGVGRLEGVAVNAVEPPLGCAAEPSSLPASCIARLSLAPGEKRSHRVTVTLPFFPGAQEAVDGRNCVAALPPETPVAEFLGSALLPAGTAAPGAYACHAFRYERDKPLCAAGMAANADGRCACPGETRFTGSACMEPGAVPAKEPQQCRLLPGQVRTKAGACICPRGTSLSKGRCVQASVDRSDPAACEVPGQVRAKSGACVCPRGTWLEGGRCRGGMEATECRGGQRLVNGRCFDIAPQCGPGEAMRNGRCTVAQADRCPAGSFGTPPNCRRVQIQIGPGFLAPGILQPRNPISPGLPGGLGGIGRGKRQ